MLSFLWVVNVHLTDKSPVFKVYFGYEGLHLQTDVELKGQFFACFFHWHHLVLGTLSFALVAAVKNFMQCTIAHFFMTVIRSKILFARLCGIEIPKQRAFWGWLVLQVWWFDVGGKGAAATTAFKPPHRAHHPMTFFPISELMNPQFA